MADRLDLQTTYSTILDSARQRQFVSYGDLAKANGASWQNVRYLMNHHLGDLVEIAIDHGWPMPSAVVVSQVNIKTGKLVGTARDGFVKAARHYGLIVSDPSAFVSEQQAAFFDWAPSAPNELVLPTDQIEAGSSWSTSELKACVEAYRKLWVAQQSGDKLNKSALRRETVKSAMPNRSEGAYEMRMQNISSVIDELGIPFVQGYLPLRNVGGVKEQLIELINHAWGREGEFEQPTADPDELETRIASAEQKMSGGSTPPPPGNKSVRKTSTSSTQYDRDANVIVWVRNEAAGTCEACDQPAPFVNSKSVPFLEVHHMRPLSEGGPDTTDNAIAGCPNCHRRLHYAQDKVAFRAQIISRIQRLVDHPKRKV